VFNRPLHAGQRGAAKIARHQYAMNKFVEILCGVAFGAFISLSTWALFCFGILHH
jgi:tetrahydromethanopterin S-methyltransferase subunit E